MHWLSVLFYQYLAWLLPLARLWCMLWLECMVTLLILALVFAFWLSFRWLETLSFYFIYSVLWLAILNKVRCWNWHFVSYLSWSTLFALNMNNYIVKWRLGAWSIQKLPLLTASLQIEECLYGWHNGGTQPWSPNSQGNKRHLSQWKYQWRKKHREEGREEELIERNLVTGTTQLEGNSMFISESLEGCSKLLGMYMCMLTYHGPIAHC